MLGKRTVGFWAGSSRALEAELALFHTQLVSCHLNPGVVFTETTLLPSSDLHPHPILNCIRISTAQTHANSPGWLEQNELKDNTIYKSNVGTAKLSEIPTSTWARRRAMAKLYL